MLILLIVLAYIGCTCEDRTMAPAFRLFQQAYEVSYESADEHDKRYEIFCTNFEIARTLNKMYPETTFGITKFSDLTIEEFKKTFMMKSFDYDEWKKVYPNSVKTTSYWDGDIPSDYNWVDHNAVTDVKNQAQCGSCWAFSAVENIEGQWALAGHTLTSLSEQQLVDCDKVDKGCDGGLMDNAFKYVIQAGGLESEADYPYTAYGGTCKFDKSKVVATISNYTDLSHDENDMQAWCYKNGPISIALNAADLQFYSHGIFDPIFCNPKELDHGLLIVGWGSEGGKKFWRVKNSWGQTWGESGYFRIIFGKNKCGIGEVPCSSIV